MKQYEVEHRGIITEKEYYKLKSFLEKNGKFLGEKDRFSVIYLQSRYKDAHKRKNELVDLKLRITNKTTELVMKHGRCSGNDTRKEFNFAIDSTKFDQMIEFLTILGFTRGVLNATNTLAFLYNEIEFALVKVPGWGYYFEAEMITDKKSIEKTNVKIDQQCKKLGLQVLNEIEFCQLLNSLNNRDGFRFNLKKQNFSQIKKRFIDYF